MATWTNPVWNAINSLTNSVDSLRDRVSGNASKIQNLSLSDIMGSDQAKVITGFATAVTGAAGAAGVSAQDAISSVTSFGAGLASLEAPSAAIDNLLAFAANPLKFLLNVLLGWLLNFLVSLVLTGAGVLVGAVDSAASTFAGVPAMIHEPFLSAGGAIAGLIIGVAETLNGVLVSLSTAAGPLSPLVVVVLWAVLAILLTWTVNVLLKVIKWIP